MKGHTFLEAYGEKKSLKEYSITAQIERRISKMDIAAHPKGSSVL
jgi:hypothetical protein